MDDKVIFCSPTLRRVNDAASALLRVRLPRASDAQAQWNPALVASIINHTGVAGAPRVILRREDEQLQLAPKVPDPFACFARVLQRRWIYYAGLDIGSALPRVNRSCFISHLTT